MALFDLEGEVFQRGTSPLACRHNACVGMVWGCVYAGGSVEGMFWEDAVGRIYSKNEQRVATIHLTMDHCLYRAPVSSIDHQSWQLFVYWAPQPRVRHSAQLDYCKSCQSGGDERPMGNTVSKKGPMRIYFSNKTYMPRISRVRVVEPLFPLTAVKHSSILTLDCSNCM